MVDFSLCLLVCPCGCSGGDGGVHHLLGTVPHPEADGAVCAELDPRDAGRTKSHLLRLGYGVL